MRLRNEEGRRGGTKEGTKLQLVLEVSVSRIAGMGAEDDGRSVWGAENVDQGRIVDPTHGWGDLCPVKEVALGLIA